ncbi:MAG TPA: hemolysin family protein [Longimicrobiaceae bacterium]
MDPDIVLPTFLFVLALLAANAYFVTAEFALLTLHRSRAEQEARDGDSRADRLLPVINSPDRLLLTAQIGSSLTTMLVGFLLARASLQWSGPASGTRVGVVVLAFAMAVLLHAALSGLLPKLVGIHRAARVAGVVLPPLRWLETGLRLVTWPLSKLVSAVARLFGVTESGFHPLVRTPEEIRILVARGHEQGVVEEDEREMIHGIFEFSQTVAREVMTPRIDVVAVPVDITLPELIRVVVEEGHSRLPVYSGTIDSVVGVLLAKDLIPLLADPDRFRDRPFDIREVMREAYFVPDTKPVDDILAEFQQQKVHLAVVLDEFGGTYGVVTMEDLLEEIVGEIDDEYDVSEPDFSATPEGDVLIDGGVSLSEVNERYGLGLPEEDYDTIGGYIFGALGRVPVPGDQIDAPGQDGAVTLVVEEIEDRRVLRVRLTRAAPVVEEVAADE